MSAWIYLIFAGVLEVGFASMIKLTENFTKTVPTLVFIVFACGSFYALTKAVETIPIGAFGTIVIGIIFYSEPAGLLRLFFLFTLIASIVGLKLVSH